jgi:hypothetical protein
MCLIMEVLSTSGTSITFCRTTRHDITE